MSRSPRKGISLVECLVILAVLVVGAGLLVPSTRNVSGAAARTRCLSNLKELMMALHNYESTGRPEVYPSTGEPKGPIAHKMPAGCIGPGAVPEERLSWMVAILPHLEQDALYRQFQVDRGFQENAQPAATVLRTLWCPAADVRSSDAVSCYVAMAGLGREAASQPQGAPGNGFMGYDRPASYSAIPDGASFTIALMETRADLGPWARGGTATLRGFDPADVPWYGKQRPFEGHRNGIQVAMADGATRFVSAKMSPQTLAAVMTVAGGETIPAEW